MIATLKRMVWGRMVWGHHGMGWYGDTGMVWGHSILWYGDTAFCGHADLVLLWYGDTAFCGHADLVLYTSILCLAEFAVEVEVIHGSVGSC